MKKIFTLVMLSILAICTVNAEEKELWTGQHAVDWGTVWTADATVRAALKTEAQVGSTLRLYVNRTATDYCKGGPTIAWQGILTGVHTDNDHGEVDFGYEDKYLDFMLTEKSMELINGEGDFVVVGHGFDLLKVTMTAPAGELTGEEFLWEGTHAVDWGTIWTDNGTVTNRLKTLAAGNVLRLYVERTAVAPDYCKACATINWKNVSTGLGELVEGDGRREDVEFDENTTFLEYELTAATFELLKEANLNVVGHGFNLLKVAVDVAKKETTGIQRVVRTAQANGYYNLAGQCVAQPVKGLYIVNGRKVLMK